MHVGAEGAEHRQFGDLPGLLAPGDLLVVNDTRVINARLRGIKDSGGTAEILIERIEADRIALCQARTSKPLRPGRVVNVAGWRLGVLERGGTVLSPRVSCPGCRIPRSIRRDATTAIYRARAGTLRQPSLSDRLCSQARRRGRSDRGTALLRGGVRPAGRSRRPGSGDHPACGRRYLSACADGRTRPAPHARRTLRDISGYGGERAGLPGRGRPGGGGRDDGGARP